MYMFFAYLILFLLLGEFLYILLFQKEELTRFKKVIEKERKFIKKMIDFDKYQERKA